MRRIPCEWKRYSTQLRLIEMSWKSNNPDISIRVELELAFRGLVEDTIEIFDSIRKFAYLGEESIQLSHLYDASASLQFILECLLNRHKRMWVSSMQERVQTLIDNEEERREALRSSSESDQVLDQESEEPEIIEGSDV